MKTKKKTKYYEWQQKAKTGACEKCGFNVRITVDHIIPVTLLTELGCRDAAYEDEENFQLLCQLCNTLKSNRLDHLNPKTVFLLKKYVAMYEEQLSPTHPSHTHKP